MKIFERVQKIPGGMMIIPLLIGAIVNTFFPQIINIGGFTQSLGAAGFPTLIAAYLFCVGTKMTLKGTPVMLKKGFSIMFAKVGIATVIALCIAKLFHGDLWGLSALAILSAMNDTNGGLFIALTSSMGNENDTGSYIVQSIETGPFLTMLVLAGAGLANIPYMSMVSVVIPVVLGAILGNLDKDIRAFCSKHQDVFFPFFGFALGNTINLKSVLSAGWSGIVLGVLTVLITGVVCTIADKLTGGSGIAGVAASGTAGNAVATPKAIAMADPTFAAIAPLATLQVAAAVIISVILTPLLTTLMYKRQKKKTIEKLEIENTEVV
jgi:2-keto-3-deoxygluconate permease